MNKIITILQTFFKLVVCSGLAGKWLNKSAIMAVFTVNCERYTVHAINVLKCEVLFNMIVSAIALGYLLTFLIKYVKKHFLLCKYCACKFKKKHC